MTSYPLAFSASANGTSGTQTIWHTQVPFDQTTSRQVDCAIPKEFGGPGSGYSPEDFFAMAVLNCFVATFKLIAEKSKVDFISLGVNGNLVVDRDERGRPCMKSMDIDVSVEPSEGNFDRIKRVFSKVIESCLVANSIKFPVEFRLFDPKDRFKPEDQDGV